MHSIGVGPSCIAVSDTPYILGLHSPNFLRPENSMSPVSKQHMLKFDLSIATPITHPISETLGPTRGHDGSLAHSNALLYVRRELWFTITGAIVSATAVWWLHTATFTM